MHLMLYKLIEKIHQQKDRPLKIIFDWDKTAQPLKPAMIYEFYEKMGSPDLSFGEFFKDFWENVSFFASPSGIPFPDDDDKSREIRNYSGEYSGSIKNKRSYWKIRKDKNLYLAN